MNYLATVSYNGARFHGFERQPHLRTIQGSLEKALSQLCGKPTLIKGAGRTDAGVHALAQRFSFQTDEIKDTGAFLFALNRLLPSDIVVKAVEAVPDSFDARHSSCGKVYCYKFSYGERDPLQKETRAQLERRNFDPAAFKKALRYFVGTHNFQNFTTKPDDVDGFLRHIEAIDVQLDEATKTGEVTFKGNGFMTYMVRLIMGCAFKAALGKIQPEEIPALIAASPRHIVAFKAPAEGLYLVEVFYAKRS
jgi:tRNA pseudouridine38-40 synthase